MPCRRGCVEVLAVNGKRAAGLRFFGRPLLIVVICVCAGLWSNSPASSWREIWKIGSVCTTPNRVCMYPTVGLFVATIGSTPSRDGFRVGGGGGRPIRCRHMVAESFVLSDHLWPRSHPMIQRINIKCLVEPATGHCVLLRESWKYK